MNMRFDIIREIQTVGEDTVLEVQYTLMGLLPIKEMDMMLAGGIPQLDTLRRIRNRLNIIVDKMEFDDVIPKGEKPPTGESTVL